MTQIVGHNWSCNVRNKSRWIPLMKNGKITTYLGQFMKCIQNSCHHLLLEWHLKKLQSKISFKHFMLWDLCGSKTSLLWNYRLKFSGQKMSWKHKPVSTLFNIHPLRLTAFSMLGLSHGLKCCYSVRFNVKSCFSISKSIWVLKISIIFFYIFLERWCWTLLLRILP